MYTNPALFIIYSNRVLSSPCMPICVSEPYIIFSGGTPVDPRMPPVPSLTVMKGNNMTVLEMEHEVVDFVTLSSTPWNSGTMHRSASLSAETYDGRVIATPRWCCCAVVAAAVADRQTDRQTDASSMLYAFCCGCGPA